MIDLNEIIMACEALTCDEHRGWTEGEDFIARARTWLPALVEELREARAEIERLRKSQGRAGPAFDWLWGFWDGNTLVAASAADREEIQKAFEQLANSIEEANAND